MATDPRLWAPDTPHGNALGHQRIAAALAWRLGVPGSDESWREPLPAEPTSERVSAKIAGDVDWAVHFGAP